MRDQVVNGIETSRIVAILRGLKKEQILPAARALCGGGIRLLEVTFQQRRPDTWEETVGIIETLRGHCGGELLVGAGTVLTEEQVELAYRAGAQYIISPDTRAAVIARTRELGMVSIPGAMTATEILAAHQAGADFVKIFPAAVLGPAYVKAVCAPISHVRLMAVGGVDSKNAADFLRAGACCVGAGGKLACAAAIAEGRFEKLTEAARELVEAVRGAT